MFFVPPAAAAEPAALAEAPPKVAPVVAPEPPNMALTPPPVGGMALGPPKDGPAWALGPWEDPGVAPAPPKRLAEVDEPKPKVDLG